ncbi:MAG: PKD domain-containing protein, partial [Vicingaceae bacterium]
TTYTVTVTDGTTSCTETDQVTITVNPLPATDAGLDASICIGDNTIIGGSPTGPTGATYQWDNTGSLSSGTVANPTATPTTTTTYTVTVTDGTTSCTSTDQVTVTVNPLPVADAGADRTICELDTTILGTPAVIGGSYQWDNSLSLDDATIAEPRAFPLATTTYSVTVTDANGCSAIDQVVVTVNTTPNVDAGIDLTICSGDTVTIGGTPTSTNTDATYSWDNVANLDDNLLANPRAFPTDTTIYVVTVTDAAGCTSTDTMRVNVNPLPQAAFEVDALCEGDFTAFTDRSTIAVGTINSWSWDFGDGLGTSNLQNAAYQYPTSGIYDVKLKVTTASGCIDSTEESITVNPIALANAGADRTICFGDTAKLGGNPTGLPGSNFSWSPSLDLNNVSISNPLAFPLSTTNYFLSVTDQNGCVNFDTVEVSVNPLPNIIASNDVSVCVNEAVQLSASGGVSYKWSPAKWLDDPLSANPIANPFKNIDYIVEGTDANGCTETDTVKVEVFNVDFNPPDTSICFGTDIQLNPIIEGDENGISFQWTPSNSLNDGNIRNPLASPMFVEEYRLQIENNAGCLDADSVTINILPRAGLDFTYLNSPRCSGAVLEIENNSTSSERYEWWLNGSFAGSEEEPKFRIDNLKENTLQLIGFNGECSDTLTEIIPAASFMELLQLKDANVFTPNGDGINDLFDPGFEGEFIGCVGFVIYDRWGKKVFDSNIGQYGWDGVTLEGERAKNGTYYYIINIAGEEIKGSVYLSR